MQQGDQVVTERRMVQLLGEWARAADIQMAQKVATAIAETETRLRIQLREEFGISLAKAGVIITSEDERLALVRERWGLRQTESEGPK